jgi:DNA-binding NarL/FixJ family response regulator
MIFSDCTAIELVPVIKELYPGVKIMLFTMQLDEVYAEAFKKYNVNYYLNKSTNEEETVVYFRRFLNNEPVLAQSTNIAPKTNPFSNLAPKELEILHYLLNGHKTNSIATSLNLSSSTVSTVKKRIFEKTDTFNLAQLLELALLYNISFFPSSSIIH